MGRNVQETICDENTSKAAENIESTEIEDLMHLPFDPSWSRSGVRQRAFVLP